MARTGHYAPWLVTALAVLAFLFKDVVKQWAHAVVDAVGRRIWRRIAGSRVMRRTAIRRYRRSLAAKLRKVEIIFRRNKPLDMARIFVPLKVAGGAQDAKRDALDAIDAQRRIVVLGPPGAGKSILLRHVAYTYACTEETASTADQIPVRLELHRLSGTSPELVDDRVIDELVDVFARNEFPDARRFVESNLAAGKLLLLLDGLDEVQSADRAHVASALVDLLERYPRAGAVITCRNAVYKGEFDAVINHTYELVEFSDQQVQAFLSSWAPEMPSSKSVGQLVLALRENPRLMVLARNPLMLTIIAHLYTESPTYQLPSSRAEFYRESSDILLRHWHEGQNRFGAAEKRAALRQLALCAQESESVEGTDRRTLAMEEAVTIVRGVLTSLGKQQDDASQMLQEIVERSGLLLAVDAGERYQFAHLTFQEYFAAEKLLSQPHDLRARHERDPDAWREVVKIWCGLVDNATDMVERLWTSGAELTALEALADAGGVEVECATRVVDAYVERLRSGDADEAVERALGAVAANAETRGRELLGALRGVLDASETAERTASAARAIAASNLPAAAILLADRYKTEAVRAPLERLGDLAVGPLSALARHGDADAFDGLARIGTAAAALALGTLVWFAPGSTATSAAWQLATLLPSSEVERALADARPPHGVVVRRLWVWAPFARGADENLVLTVARVADLIAECPDELVPDKPIALDPRIAVALCAIDTVPIRSFEFRTSDASPALLATVAEEPEGARALSDLDLRSRSPEVSTVIELFLDFMPPLRGVRSSHRAAPRLRRVSSDDADHFTRVLVADSHAPKWWSRVFLDLPTLLRLELVRRADLTPPATPATWTSMRRPIDFSFPKSVHRLLIRVLVVGASLVAATGVAYAFPRYGSVGKALAALAAAALVSGCAWLFTERIGQDSTGLAELAFAPLLLFGDRDLPMALMAGFVPALGWFSTVALSDRLGLDTRETVVAWVAWLGLLVGVMVAAEAKTRPSINVFRDLDLSPARWVSTPISSGVSGDEAASA